MNQKFGDARLEELKLLSEIDRQGSMTILPMMSEPRRDMIAFLVAEEFVTDPAIEWRHHEDERYYSLPGESQLERELNGARLRLLSRVLGLQEVQLELTHRGRIRLSELKQNMRSGRNRESYGILWDGRHLDQDLEIAVLEASDPNPLSIAFLDMNGLKSINDNLGHDAGDLAIRAYFQTLSAALRDRGEAYRVGGDEVIALLPSHDSQAATTVLRTACRLLTDEQLQFEGHVFPRISVSIGIATTVDPNIGSAELRRWADKAMYRAKEEAHKHQPSPSVIAIEGIPDIFVVNVNEKLA